jgi:hypothetical protein
MPQSKSLAQGLHTGTPPVAILTERTMYGARVESNPAMNGTQPSEIKINNFKYYS